jgi:hypothetical protein
VQALGAHAAIAIYNLQTQSRQRELVGGLMRAQEKNVAPSPTTCTMV